jgi:anaerobic selenocysteine-containing dehydrogenase
MYATLKPAVLYQRTSIEMQSNCVQALRAIAILRAITGNIDIEGGNVFPCSPEGFVHPHMSFLQRGNNTYNEGRPFTDEEEYMRIGAKEYPLISGPPAPLGPVYSPGVIKAILTEKPYPIKGLLVSNNLLICLPNSREVYKALKEVSFLVVREFFMTPTAEMADILLPAAHWLEVDEVFAATMNIISARTKAIEPVGECWDEMKLSFELLKRMGLSYFATPAQNAEEELDYLLKGMGMNFEDLKKKSFLVTPMEYRKYEKNGFNTPSGKVELQSSLFEKYGYDPLPYYMEPLESPVSTPELAEEYPFILIAGRRYLAYMHSMGRDIPWLRELVPSPDIELHPQTAGELGIKEGDWVWLELSPPNEKGRIRNRAKLSSGIDPQVVQCDSQWWFPEMQGPDYGHWDVNINALISGSGRGDQIAGTIPLTGLLCKIYKDQEG